MIMSHTLDILLFLWLASSVRNIVNGWTIIDNVSFMTIDWIEANCRISRLLCESFQPFSNESTENCIYLGTGIIVHGDRIGSEGASLSANWRVSNIGPLWPSEASSVSERRTMVHIMQSSQWIQWGLFKQNRLSQKKRFLSHKKVSEFSRKATSYRRVCERRNSAQ